MIYQLAAIGAGICFALSPFFSMQAVKELGPTKFNRFRMSIVFVMLLMIAIANSSLTTELLDWWLLIAASSLIGIFLGDTLLFFGLKRIGPRRNSVVFALNAPLTVLLGWLFLEESLSFYALLGTFTITTGVIIAIAFGRRTPSLHEFDSINGKLIVGVAITLGSALCQAVSLILIRPAMEAGVDSVSASMLRSGIAALCLWILAYVNFIRSSKAPTPTPKLTLRTFINIAISGFLAMGLGMSLLLFGLKGGETGIISTLSSISPFAALPILWIVMKKRPAANAWIGAVFVVSGTSMLFLL
jgi:drug/metabolite transporter (DMT)-like permease